MPRRSYTHSPLAGSDHVPRTQSTQMKFQATEAVKTRLVKAAGLLKVYGVEDVNGWGPMVLDFIERDLDAYLAARLREKGASEAEIKSSLKKIR